MSPQKERGPVLIKQNWLKNGTASMLEATVQHSVSYLTLLAGIYQHMSA